eukprot:scaffold4499_cov122-Isochrysis_galbana.AAC.7
MAGAQLSDRSARGPRNAEVGDLRGKGGAGVVKAQTPPGQSGLASETKYQRPRMGRRRFPLHHHLSHAAGRTHPLQAHRPPRPHHPRKRKRTHPPKYGTICLCRMCGLRRENSPHMGALASGQRIEGELPSAYSTDWAVRRAPR